MHFLLQARNAAAAWPFNRAGWPPVRRLAQQTKHAPPTPRIVPIYSKLSYVRPRSGQTRKGAQHATAITAISPSQRMAHDELLTKTVRCDALLATACKTIGVLKRFATNQRAERSTKISAPATPLQVNA